MNGSEYQRRLQRVLNYIEDNLQSRVSLADLANEACYSPNHFIWVFQTVTGLTPLDYVRQRKVTEAAREILAGGDIVDVAYRYGFSAQDAFTRSFRRAIGSPPGRLRRDEGLAGVYTPALKLLLTEGGTMLGYNLDCDPVESMLRIEQLLTDEVKELVYRIAGGKMSVREIDPRTCGELVKARVVRVEGDSVVIDTSVFLQEDLERIHAVATKWGARLADDIAGLEAVMPQMDSGLKRLLIGMNGIDAGVFDLLIAEDYAFNHRATTGRYAGAKVDFYEICDAYQRFGPYLSGGYGFAGER